MEFNVARFYDEVEKKLLSDGNPKEYVPLGIKVMCFLNIISGYKLNFDHIDYSSNEIFNEEIYRNVELIHDDPNLIDILLIIVKIGAFRYNPSLNEINSEIKKLTNEQKKELFDYSGDSDFKTSDIFVTNKSLVKAVLDLVDLDKCENVLDVTCGEGIFLTECAKQNRHLKLRGYEIHVVAYIISRMRILLNQASAKIYEGNVLRIHLENEYDVAFSDSPWRLNIKDVPAEDDNMIVNYQQKKRNADWYFTFKAINAIKKDGKAISLMPLGALSTSASRESRNEIINNKMLEKVILMPDGTYPSTNVQYVIMVFSYNNEKVEFIDASECYKRERFARLYEVDEVAFANLLQSKESEKKTFASYEEIDNNDGNLEPKIYFNRISDIKLINPKTIGDIAEVFTGFQYTSKNVKEVDPGKGNISVLKINNIDDGHIDYEKLTSIDIEEDKVKKYLLKENDIVLTSKGVGLNFAVITDIKDRKVIPFNNLMVIRITSDEVDPVYLCNFFMSKTGRLILETLQTGSIINNISRKSIMEMNVPVLDLDTQETIANRYLMLRESIHEEKKKLNDMLMKMNSIYDDEAGE